MGAITRQKLSLIMSKDSFFVYLKIFLLIVLSYLGFLNQDFFLSYPEIAKLYSLLFYYMFLNVLFGYGGLFIAYIYRRKNKHPQDYVDNFTIGVSRIGFFLQHFFFLLILIHTLFINISTFLTSLSLVAVAFVLIFKDYISNFLNGIIIMFSGNIKIRDFVKIGDQKGRVTNLSFQNVELKDDNGDYVFIPNTLVCTKEFVNYSKGTVKTITFPFSVLKSNYIKLCGTLIKDVKNEYNSLLTSEESVLLKVESVEKEEVKLKLVMTVSKFDFKLEQEVKNFVTQKIVSLPSKKK